MNGLIVIFLVGLCLSIALGVYAYKMARHSDSDRFEAAFLTSLVCIPPLVIEILIGCACISRIPDNKAEIAYFKQMQQVVNDMYESGKGSSLTFNNEILDINSTIVDRQTSLKEWGFWSYYYNCGYENLKPITLPKKPCK